MNNENNSYLEVTETLRRKRKTKGNLDRTVRNDFKTLKLTYKISLNQKERKNIDLCTRPILSNGPVWDESLMVMMILTNS